MKIVLLLGSFVINFSLFSQQMILHDPVSGKVFSSEKYSGVNGSPFLYDKWITGSVTIEKGIYNNLELKLDAYSNTLYFNRNDEPYEFQDDVIGFLLMPKVSDSSTYLYFKKGISGAGLRANQFVQVLTEGRINLYKAESKLVTDVNEINRGLVKTFGNTIKYIIIKDNQAHEIKISKKEIFEIIKEKEDKIQSYIAEKKLSTKKESDLVLVVKYYNSL